MGLISLVLPGKPHIYVYIYTHTHIHACMLSHVRLCNPIDCSSPGSPVHGILQVRILEWVVVSYSRGSFWPRNRTHVSWLQANSLPRSSWRSPYSYPYIYVCVCVLIVFTYSKVSVLRILGDKLQQSNRLLQSRDCLLSKEDRAACLHGPHQTHSANLYHLPGSIDPKFAHYWSTWSCPVETLLC